MVTLTAFLAEVIVLEASLSFLGLGVVEPTPAWGVMLRDFAGQYAEGSPVASARAGGGDQPRGVRLQPAGGRRADALDPRLQG